MDGQPIQGHGAAAGAVQGLGVPAQAQQAPPTRLTVVWRLGGRTVSIVAGGLSVAGYGAYRALAAAAAAPGAVRDLGMRVAMQVPRAVYAGAMVYGWFENARALIALYNLEPPPAGNWVGPLALASWFSIRMLDRIGVQQRQEDAQREALWIVYPQHPGDALLPGQHLEALTDLLNGVLLPDLHQRSVTAVLRRLDSPGTGLPAAQSNEQVREAIARAIGLQLGVLRGYFRSPDQVHRVIVDASEAQPAGVVVALATGFFTPPYGPQSPASSESHTRRQLVELVQSHVFQFRGAALLTFAAQRIMQSRMWVKVPADLPALAVAVHLGLWAAGGPGYVPSKKLEPIAESGKAGDPPAAIETKKTTAATPAELGEAMSRSPAAVLSTDLVGPADQLKLLRTAYELPGLLESCGIETQLREIGEAPVSLETQAEALCILLQSAAPAQRHAVFEGARRVLLREPDASRVSGKTPWSATSEQFTAILALYEAYLELAPLVDTGALPAPERQALLDGYRSFLDGEAARMELLGALGPPAIETKVETKSDAKGAAKAEKKSAQSASADRADASRQLDAMLYERLSLFAQQLDAALHPPETKVG